MPKEDDALFPESLSRAASGPDTSNGGVDSETPCILLVHGTVAGEDRDTGIAWWQQGSDFVRFLSEELRPGTVQPKGHVFHWSGENLESARRRAGEALAAVLLRLERERRAYSIVAHSHGGSVLWHALQNLWREQGHADSLKRWVTVGTPFLTYGPDPYRLWPLAPGIAAAAAAAWFVPLAWDVYRDGLWEFVRYPTFQLWVVAPASLLALGVIAGLVARSLFTTQRAVRAESRRRRLGQQCFESLRGRYVSLISELDEARNGLAGSLRLSGEVVPRRRSVFSWIYDTVLAAAGDDFIWRQLARRSQGSDLAGLRLIRVSTDPVGDSVGQPLPDVVTEELERAAGVRAQASITDVRRALFEVAREARPVEYLQEAAAGSGVASALVHTSYFDSGPVRQLIVDGLTTQSSSPVVSKGTALSAPKWSLRLALLAASALTLSVLGLGVQLDALLSPITREAITEAAIREAPFLAGSYDDPEVANEFLWLVARSGRWDLGDRLLGDVDSTSPDRFIALSRLASGLWSAGDKSRANQLMDRALASVSLSPGALLAGTSGPLQPVSLGGLAFASSLAEAGRMEAVDALAALAAKVAPELGRSLVYHAAVLGLVRSSRFGDVSPTLEKIEIYEKRLDAFEAFVRAAPPEELLRRALATLPAVDRDAAAATVLESLADQSTPTDALSRDLETIRTAGPRIRGAIAVARRLSRDGNSAQARELIEAELRSFPARPRHPLDGLAIHYVRLAEAFATILDDKDRAETLLRFAESLPLEKVEDTVYADYSGAERAQLWARLGNAHLALARALALVNEDERDEALDHLVRILARAPIPFDEIATAEGRIRARLAQLDATGSTMSSWERLALLDDVGADARRVKDPRTRSRLVALVARSLLVAGHRRRALEVSRLCGAVDQLSVVNAMLSLDLKLPPPAAR